MTPWPRVTEALGGCIPRGLHIIQGGSGVGKTALALQLAAGCRCKCLYVTCEIPPDELLIRAIPRETPTRIQDIRNGNLSGDDVRGRIQHTLKKTASFYGIDATEHYVSPEEIKTFAESLKSDGGHILIIVDSLHAWVSGAQRETQGYQASEYELLNDHLDRLRAIAISLRCPVLAIAERTKEANKNRSDDADPINDGAGSRKLSYATDCVFDLQLNAKGPVPTAQNKPIIVTLCKNRAGFSGQRIALTFNGEQQKFTEIVQA